MQVYRVEGHTRPCLGVMFAPWDPSLLLYNEETKHVFTRDYQGRLQEPDHSAAEGGGSRFQALGLGLGFREGQDAPPPDRSEAG